MKGKFLVFLRDAWKPVAGALALGTLLVGCGDKTDPEAVGLDELKFASGLKAWDMGNGTVRLVWNGVNNEKDFGGYNVYGVKGAADVSAMKGKVIELLDDKGEPTADGKATLAKMNYNGTDWETAGSANSEAGDLAVVPYYKTKTGEDIVLPSCMPKSASGTDTECVANTTEGATGTFNGTTWIDMTGLKTDGEYCFTVLATLDEGKKVAQTTSEIACVTPKSKVTASAKASNESPSGTISYAIDLGALRTKCGAAGGSACGDLDTDNVNVAPTVSETLTASECAYDSTTKKVSTSAALCIERFSKKAAFTGGTGGAVQDLGYYPAGFDDASLPPVPKLTAGEVQSTDGYSLPGQSLPIEDKHIYVVAEPAGTNSYYYHLIYVSGMSGNVDHATETTFNMEVRVAGKADAR